MKITLYSQDNCPACENMKKKFTQEGKDYVEMKIGRDITVEAFKEKYPLIRSVPYIVVE